MLSLLKRSVIQYITLQHFPLYKPGEHVFCLKQLVKAYMVTWRSVKEMIARYSPFFLPLNAFALSTYSYLISLYSSIDLTHSHSPRRFSFHSDTLLS